ncbi:hypothetical protein [Leuconostoc lactis]|uniref:hypothetical protein n=1 Tax=Leuconostoc lactis TaxID=1246 RepID=UPI00289A23EA|nr:hypothetical protein [Leuconostoc lactis]
MSDFIKNIFSYGVPLFSLVIAVLAYRSSNFPVKVLNTNRPIFYSFGVMNKNTTEMPTGNKGLLVLELLIQNLKPHDVSFFDLHVKNGSDFSTLNYLSKTRLEVFSDDALGLLAELDKTPTVLPLRLPYADYGVLKAGQVTAIQIVFGVNDEIPEAINISFKLPQYKFGIIASNKEFSITKTLSNEQLTKFNENIKLSYQDVIDSSTIRN